MKKTVYFAAMFLTALTLLAGCGGKNSRYTYRQTGIEQLEAGDYEAAVLSFDQAIENSKGVVGKFELDVLKYRAEAEYRLGDYEASAHTYDILIQVDQEIPEYLYMRCMARAGAGDAAGALEDYTKAVVLDRESPLRETSLLAAGASLLEAGNEEDAMTLYEQAQEAGLGGAELYNRMGMCRMKEAKEPDLPPLERDSLYDEALTYFARGIEEGESPALQELKFNQAVVYEYKGDFARARELMEQYVADYGSDEAAKRELAFLRTR